VLQRLDHDSPDRSAKLAERIALGNTPRSPSNLGAVDSQNPDNLHIDPQEHHTHRHIHHHIRLEEGGSLGWGQVVAAATTQAASTEECWTLRQ